MADDPAPDIERAIARGEAEGLWNLSLEDRFVYVISEAEVRCDINGIDSFLDAHGPRGVDALASAYAAVGATDLAAVLREISASLPDASEHLLARANELITARSGYSYDDIARAFVLLRGPMTESKG